MHGYTLQPKCLFPDQTYKQIKPVINPQTSQVFALLEVLHGSRELLKEPGQASKKTPKDQLTSNNFHKTNVSEP